MVLDKSMPNLPSGAAELHDACVDAAASVAKARPHLIVLHTPHGISMGASLAVYRGRGAAGNALWMGSWSEFAVEVPFDDEQAGALLAALQEAGVDAQGLTCFSGMNAPIRWAEVVPLWFLSQTCAAARYVIISQGCGGAAGSSSKHRASVSPAAMPSTMRAGETVLQFAQRSAQRVFVVFSGDLSHLHGNDKVPLVQHSAGDCSCPCPDARFANPMYKKAAPEAAHFDAAIDQWVHSLDATQLVHRACSLLPNALACGFDGFCMLQAIAQALRDDDGGGGYGPSTSLGKRKRDGAGKCVTTGTSATGAGAGLRPRVLCPPIHPTYFGMMVAVFECEPSASTAPAPAAAPAAPNAEAALAETAVSTGGSGSTSASDTEVKMLQLPPAPSPASLDTRTTFRGRVAMVTGAGHGIGRAIALALSALGAEVVACGIEAAELDATVRAAAAVGGRCRAVALDLRHPEQLRELVGRAGEQKEEQVQEQCQEQYEEQGGEQELKMASPLGKVDILVCNAGGVLGQTNRPLEDVPLDSWRAIFDVNTTGAFACAQAVAPHMKRQRWGRIVVISSGAGLRKSLTGIQAYCAAKHAQVGLVRQLSHELGPFGITVNSVAPGFVRSNPSSDKQWLSYDAAKRAQILRGISTRRLGTPQDIAHAVLYFASDQAAWCTGQCLEVNGGH